MILVHQLIAQAVPGAILCAGRHSVDRPVRRIMAIEGTIEGLRNVIRHDLIVVVPGSWRVSPLEFIKSVPSTGASGVLLWETLTAVESDCDVWQAPASTTFSSVLQSLIEILLANRDELLLELMHWLNNPMKILGGIPTI